MQLKKENLCNLLNKVSGVVGLSFYDLGFLILIISAFLFYNRFKKYKQNKHLEMFASLGKKEQWLLESIQDKGYSIKAVYPEVSASIDEDYKTYTEHFRYPFIISKNKRNYLVKIRKDKESIRLSSSRYRRNLLIECAIFNVQGIVTAELTGKLREFNITLPKKKNVIPRTVLIIITAFTSGFYIAYKFL